MTNPDGSAQRHIDLTNEQEYETCKRDAAVAYAQGINYSGSYQALALTMAFGVGADTSITLDYEALLLALIAGRRWAVTERTDRGTDA